ncbi:MAG: diacylglycerol/lipid kinase family protein [Mycobacteriaceae bacterium]
MRALLVVNPNATSTSPAGRTVLARALSSALELRVVHTDHCGHAAELAAQARLDGIDVIVVHGGDGTINEVVNGMLGPPNAVGHGVRRIPALAVVPGGSANVFARALGIAADPLEATQQLLEAITGNSRRSVGLAHTDDRWFTVNAGLGWDAEVVQTVEEHRKNGKAATPARYCWAAVSRYFRSKHHKPKLTVHLTGEEPTMGLHMVFITNTDPWTYLGARPVRTNPQTSFSGGLGIFGLTSLSWFTIVRVIPQILARDGNPRAGTLLRRDDVGQVRVRCSEPTGLQLDGDYLGLRSEVVFSTVANAVQVLVQPKER